MTAKLPLPAPPSSARRRASRFERLAGWAQRRRRRALGLWVAVLVAVTGISMAAGSTYDNAVSLPGTESQRVVDDLARHAPAQAGDSVQIVVRDRGGVTRPATRARVQRMLSAVRRLGHVAEVQSPYANPEAVSRDGTVAYATVKLAGRPAEVAAAGVRKVIDTAQDARGGGLDVELGGDAIRYGQAPPSSLAESAGSLAALVVLAFTFGSLLAAGLPLLTALIAVGSTTGLIAIASHVVAVTSYTPPLMTLVGLGVGIDYALLIFSRYRTELLACQDREAALSAALDSAGRSVVFAGATVIIGLLGLFAIGLGFLQGIALAVSLTVLVTMLASLTLLPALMAVAGGRIERGVRRRAGRTRGREGDRWRVWARWVQRRPTHVAAVGVLVLALLALPALGMRLGSADAGNDPRTTTSRKAYDLLARGFGPGVNGPFVVVAEGASPGAAKALRAALRRTPGIAEVGTPVRSTDGHLTTVTAIPQTSPQADATDSLLKLLRHDVLPPVARATHTKLLVGGATAANADGGELVGRRLPGFLAIVIGLSALLLLVAFRSLLIPIKAALLNVLTIGASLGVVTLVFQHGLFGVEPGPVETVIPVLIFAIVFGLSMDYEVFLVSRMHESWQQDHDASRAVREGLAGTGRVITAAGLVMMVVFGAFLLNPDRMMQQFGLGLATAVVFDALVIRCLIVPAAMELLGPRAWWLPQPLGRLVPRVALEHSSSSSGSRNADLDHGSTGRGR
ncbi:MAG: hypothetical protein JWO02_4382 [Solirubrobacterales bacterium]|nr:hypothetical protein [Solirubrobacterales bacterium]